MPSEGIVREGETCTIEWLCWLEQCLIAGGAGAAAGSYAAIAVVTEPSNEVITSCYNTTNGAVRMVKPGVTCATGEKKLTWASNIKPKIHVVGAVGEPAYTSTWKAYDGPPFGNASFYKDSDGVVHLTGLACRLSTPSLCTSATLIGGTLPIFSLPVGFRPSSQLLFTTLSAGQANYYHTRVDITAGGQVELIAPPDGGEDWVSFRRHLVPGQLTRPGVEVHNKACSRK